MINENFMNSTLRSLHLDKLPALIGLSRSIFVIIMSLETFEIIFILIQIIIIIIFKAEFETELILPFGHSIMFIVSIFNILNFNIQLLSEFIGFYFCRRI